MSNMKILQRFVDRQDWCRWRKHLPRIYAKSRFWGIIGTRNWVSLMWPYPYKELKSPHQHRRSLQVSRHRGSGWRGFSQSEDPGTKMTRTIKQPPGLYIGWVCQYVLLFVTVSKQEHHYLRHVSLQSNLTIIIHWALIIILPPSSSIGPWQ